MDLTSVYAEITKTEPRTDGSLLVYGKATGSDLDLDQQRMDPEWLRTAMPDWFAIGNIREQHDSKRAVGKATEYEAKESDHWIKANIVDPVAVAKTQAGIFTGFSIGVAQPRVVKSPDAPRGLIKDGKIVEVSLVDRPCLPTATLTMCKAAAPGWEGSPADLDTDRGLVKCEELELDKASKPSDAPDVEDAAEAASVTSVKVTDTSDGLDAGYAFGKSVVLSNTERRDIQNLIADTLAKASGSSSGHDEAGDISGAEQAIAQVAKLIISEAQALADMPSQDCDTRLLMSAVDALRVFSNREKLEAQALDPDTPAMVLAAHPDAVKAKYDASKLRQMAKDGRAMRNPNGEPSYPISDEEDLRNAIRAVGRGSGDHNAIRRHIMKRARAMGKTDLLPDDWTSGGSNADSKKTVESDADLDKSTDTAGSDESGEGAEGGDGVDKAKGRSSGTGDKDKAGESKDGADGQDGEGQEGPGDAQINPDEGGTAWQDSPGGAGDMTPTDEDADTDGDSDSGEKKGSGKDGDKAAHPDTPPADADTSKAATVDDDQPDAMVKALTAALEKSDSPLRKTFEGIVEDSTKTIAESVTQLTERLVKVEQMPIPGGPALRRTETERNQARKDDLTRTATYYKSLAAASEDPMLRRGYTLKAEQVLAEVKTIGL